MAKIIAFSGPQGSGKTTLINEFGKLSAQMGLNVLIDDVKVSRSEQQAIGASNLSDVIQDYDRMANFQHAVFMHKLNRLYWLIETHKDDNVVILTDRSFSDIVAYYQLWSRKLGVVSWRLPTWATYAEELQRNKVLIDGVVYVPYMREVGWEDDPRRGFKEDIQTMDTLIRNSLDRTFSSDIKCVISDVDIQKRVQDVLDFIMKINTRHDIER